MKEFAFQILPSQFNEWARQHNRLPDGVNVGEHEATEILFTALFPELKDYSAYGNIASHSSWKKDGSKVERSVKAQPYYRHVAGKSLKVLTVRITDTENGTQALLPKLEGFGLLGGDELINAEMDAIQDDHEAEAESRKSNQYLILGIVILVPIVLYLLSK